MNASEARKTVEIIRAQKETERAAREALRHTAAVKKGREDHEQFVKDFNEDADNSILEAVKEGKKQTYLYLGSADERRDVDDWFTNHGYVKDINKTIARLRKAGFSVERDIKTVETYSNYEAGETYDYYVAQYKVSW
jgi:hypothetical protein